MNTLSNLPELHKSRVSWPAAAVCAFVVSVLEIISRVFFGLQRSRTMEGPGSTVSIPTDLLYGVAGVALVVIGIAATATALWGIGRRQKVVSPVAARCGQAAVVTYVVVGVLVSAMGALSVTAAGFGGARSFALAMTLPLTIAFGCLGWASLGGRTPAQRWASRALIVVAAAGVLMMIRRLSGALSGPDWLWLGTLHTGLRSAMWVAVGVWLRRVP